MITIPQALKIVAREVTPLRSERIDIADAVGRVLAEDMVADIDLPPFDRSQMDGYAVRAADTANVPVDLVIVGESAAGRGWDGKLKKGEAVRIMTGARVPVGADAVQKVEVTKELGGVVTIFETVKRGMSVVKRGSEVKKGRRLLRAGDLITTHNIATLASFGYAKVRVAKMPRVAILSTGSEIVDINKRPRKDQIRNSNSVMLASMTASAGGLPTIFPHVGDTLTEITTAIRQAAKSTDVLVITGGVSVGKYDLTKDALASLGAEPFFDKVALKPGKPTVFGRLGKTLIFGLPGNPVSAAVTFHLFVRRVILAMQGACEKSCPTGYAIAKRDVRGTRDRDAYLPATLSTDKHGRLIVDAVKGTGSSDLVSLGQAQVLVLIPRGTALKEGEPVKILYL
ncbi:MAG: molybdopterin molybdotransferase MoeA [Acidobacteriota bacterium]|nr:MAG: molybdopterin molybdotransferase MoeA [Acidobacteriota bacterium]